MKRLFIILLSLLLVPSVLAQVDTSDNDEEFPAPQYASEETFALVSVPRANLRNAPSVTESTVVDIALWGERYPIVGVFYPGESTVIDPRTDDDFVFDDPGEREVWYLLDVGSGQVWIFGGLVLVSQPDGIPVGDQELTPEQQQALQEQLALIDGTLGVTANARLRSGPGTDYSQVAIVPFNGRVVVVGRNQYSTWFYVNYNGTFGWVSIYLLATPTGYNAQAVPIVR